MIFLLFLFLASLYIVFVLIVAKVMKRMEAGKAVRVAVILSLLALPFVDVFVPRGLFLVYQAGGSLQKINREESAPGSVCWIDNVWPGFDEYGRHWMVKSYLDGKHLQMLALNGNDGKIYLYRYETKDKPEVFDTVRQLPPMRYLVTFQPLPLGLVEQWFVHGDEIRIMDLKSKEVMAHSRRYLSYTPRFFLAFRSRGDSPFEGGGSVGDERAYEFDDKVLFRYAGVREPDFDKNFLRRSSYALAVMRWKRTPKMNHQAQ